MKRIMAVIVALSLILAGCGNAEGKSGEDAGVTGQKTVSRLERYSSVLPADYEWFDYGQAALAYDALVFDSNATGIYLPLSWQDETNDTFAFAAYVGDWRYASDGSEEAVACIASVLSATLMGIDKSNQNGVNYVSDLHAWFSEEEQVVCNNPGAASADASMWYMIFPAILFAEVSVLYPGEAQIREDTLATIESWYQAFLVMNESGSFDYTGFDFSLMEPYRNGTWTEPDCAAGIAVLLQIGYELTGKEEYAAAVLECLEYVDNFEGSSLYEVLLYFAPALAARKNAQEGTTYDIDNLLSDVLNGSSIPRGGWGSLVGEWGDYSVNGLMGSTTDGGGYAFSMNTFAAGYAFSSLAKYDTRYAEAMGIWYLNASSSARYFFPSQTDAVYQSASESDVTTAFLEISGDALCYEGIRKSYNSRTPWVGGDPTVYDWAETDLSLYSSAYIGMFASVVEQTDVEGVLKINCNAAESDAAYATWLLYNPYESDVTVTYELPEGEWSLFDSVSKKVIAESVSGSYELTLAGNAAVVIVELPEGSNLTHEDGQYQADGIWIATDTVTVDIVSHENNEKVSGETTLTVQVSCTDDTDSVGSIVVEIDDTVLTFDAADTIRFDTGDYAAGSKTIYVEVVMNSGRKDRTSLRLNFEKNE